MNLLSIYFAVILRFRYRSFLNKSSLQQMCVCGTVSEENRQL